MMHVRYISVCSLGHCSTLRIDCNTVRTGPSSVFRNSASCFPVHAMCEYVFLGHAEPFQIPPCDGSFWIKRCLKFKPAARYNFAAFARYNA